MSQPPRHSAQRLHHASTRLAAQPQAPRVPTRPFLAPQRYPQHALLALALART